MTEIEFIKDLARKYANTCEFKSDFPHDWNSVNDGYIEGFKDAEQLLNKHQIITEIIKDTNTETLHMNNVKFTADEIVNKLEKCKTLDEALMFFKKN